MSRESAKGQLDQPEYNPLRWVLVKCCDENPGISVKQTVLGGIPHIEGTRLSVAQVLDRLYVLGSVEAVAKYYAPKVSEDQIREAISYAQSVLEFLGAPSQAYD